MHKSTWWKAGRPITSETGSILKRLTKIVSSALNALRPSFQRRWLQTLRQAKIYVTEALNGPPVTLDGQNGIIRRVRAINRYISKNYYEHPWIPMETIDLSECFCTLDQKEIVRVLSRMNMAIVGKKYLAILPREKTGR